MTTHGYFYAVSTANNTAEDNVSKVYQIAKLLQVFPLPVRVCSIYPQKINGKSHTNVKNTIEILFIYARNKILRTVRNVTEMETIFQIISKYLILFQVPSF